ncbi:MAG: glycosyltransferase [Candidatus Dojkabacteria bacterium]
MFSFLYQGADWLVFQKIHYFVLFFVFVWVIWLFKSILSLFYKPIEENFDIKSSVIIPVVDEHPDLFDDVLMRITDQIPFETIVIINGDRNHDIEEICKKYKNKGVIYEWTEIPGKRNALKLAFEKAKGDIFVIVDSDTLWTKNTLIELVKPFKDNKIGGVTTKQKIYQSERNYLTRFADWLEDIRSIHSLPSMSITGSVGCLPGRTIAIRKEIILKALPDFLSEKFLGIHLEVSDDRSLTNYVLKYGYNTFFQRTSVVYTDAPVTFPKFYRQQLRWAKGSQYNTLRMFGWMLRKAPFLAFLYFTDIITPFFLYGLFLSIIIRFLNGSHSTEIIKGTPLDNGILLVTLALLGALLSIGLRQLPHLINKPKDILFLPVFLFMITFILSSIRIIGFATMAEDSSWGTRPRGYKEGSSRVKAESASDKLKTRIPYVIALFMLLFFTYAGVISG